METLIPLLQSTTTVIPVIWVILYHNSSVNIRTPSRGEDKANDRFNP